MRRCKVSGLGIYFLRGSICACSFRRVGRVISTLRALPLWHDSVHVLFFILFHIIETLPSPLITPDRRAFAETPRWESRATASGGSRWAALTGCIRGPRRSCLGRPCRGLHACNVMYNSQPRIGHNTGCKRQTGTRPAHARHRHYVESTSHGACGVGG